MARALIKINGVDGSNDDMPIATLVQLDNDNSGGETTYLWSILDQPEGAADSLSATNIHNPTLTPNKEGTYLLQLIVNGQFTNTAVVGVRQLKSGERVPAGGETLEDSLTTGWKLAANRNLQLLDNAQADSNLVVCQSYVGAAAGDVVKFTGVQVIKSGLPGQEVVLLIAKALAETTRALGIVVGAVRGGSPSNTLVYVRVAGLVQQEFAGDPSPDDPVYLDPATSLPTLTSHTVQIGHVVFHDGVAHMWRFFMEGHATAAVVPPGLFVAGAGSGSALQNNGTGNTAPGNDSLAIGSGSQSGGTGSFAQGNSFTAANFACALNESSANGIGSLASGGSTANGQWDVALGNGCVATGAGLGAFAVGNGCGALANSAFALGNGSSARADSSGAVNEGFVTAGATAAFSANVSLVEAAGVQAAAFNTSAAAATNAFAIGESARAIRESQFARASGRTSANGDKQTSVIDISGTTPGSVANESVELHYGAANNQVFSGENGKAYQCTVSLVAGGVQAGPTRVSRSIIIKFNFRRDAGVSTITATGVGEGYGDASTNDWTLVATVGVAPDRIVVTFTTGATASKCTVNGELTFTEVAYS